VAQRLATAEIGSRRYDIASSEDFDLSDAQRFRCGSSLRNAQTFTPFRRLVSDFYRLVCDAGLVRGPVFH